MAAIQFNAAQGEDWQFRASWVRAHLGHLPFGYVLTIYQKMEEA